MIGHIEDNIEIAMLTDTSSMIYSLNALYNYMYCLFIIIVLFNSFIYERNWADSLKHFKYIV